MRRLTGMRPAGTGPRGSRRLVLIKITADGEHAQIAMDQSGRSGAIWLRSSNAPLVQARFGS